jgi:hypothetical protein
LSEEFAANKHAPSHEVLFHVLYSWHCKNPTATKRKLASLMEKDLYKQAVKLDPKCKLDHYLFITSIHRNAHGVKLNYVDQERISNM